MMHLLSHSVYSPVEEISPFLLDGDGIELLTGYFPVNPSFFDRTVSVHLPYSTDWYSVWSGRTIVPDDVSDDDAKYVFYGKSREDILDNLTDAVRFASAVSLKYAVMHAGSISMDEVLSNEYSDKDGDVLSAFAEMMNTIASRFPGGEMPFKVVFENQWWPGIKFLDDSGFRILERKIEFENWGLCVDTGHLLVTTRRSYSEETAIEVLNGIIDDYPEDMIDRIFTMHLHVNTSADFINSHVEDPDFKKLSVMERFNMAYPYVCRMDEHRPFTTKDAVGIVERLSPEYVTHEMGASDTKEKVRDYLLQRSLF